MDDARVLEALDRIETKVDQLLEWKEELDKELGGFLETFQSGGIMGMMGSLFKK